MIFIAVSVVIVQGAASAAELKSAAEQEQSILHCRRDAAASA